VGEPESVSTVSESNAHRPERRRRGRLIAAIVGGLLVVAAAIVVTAVMNRPDPTPAAQASGPASQAATVTTPDAVAKDLTTQGFTVTGLQSTEIGTGLVARESVETTINGVDAYIYTFGNEQGTQTWAQMSSSFGGIAVVGETWAISIDDHTLATEIAGAIGGRVL
jgi:hypothetical protein